MPLKPYAIDAIHSFPPGGRVLQEAVIGGKKCFLCAGWVYTTITGRNRENPDFTVLKKSSEGFFCLRDSHLFTAAGGGAGEDSDTSDTPARGDRCASGR